MTRAHDIARAARQQALDALEAERAAEAAAKRLEEEVKAAIHREDYEAALPILAEWFPGVEWEYGVEGPYDRDTILYDASEAWPWSFKLKVDRYLIDMNDPEAGYRVDIQVGDYKPDSSILGHSYFSGMVVNSAADVGAYLEKNPPPEPVCRCWNDGQYGRVHREDCPVHS